MTEAARVHPAWLLLLWGPGRVQRRLERLHAAGVVEVAPTLWQVWLGVLYMWARIVLRSETIGLSDGAPVRDTPGARALRWRPVRLVQLLRTRSVSPLDFVGLGSSTAQIVRHLLGAYHPGDNALYDLQILAVEPGALEELRDRLREVVAGTHPRATLLKDLAVYDGYHERLLSTVERWLAEGPTGLDATHPDTTLPAFLAWCARAPAGPRETLSALRDGRFSLLPGA